MQVQERIRKIADELFNGNISAFCRAIDVKQPTMNTILGERKSKPSYDVLLNIVNAKALNISAEWLLNGEGDMLTQKKEAPKTSSADTTKKNGYITYLLPMSAMGGSLTGFAEPGVLLQNCEAVVSPIENVLDTPNGVIVKEVHESNREGYVSCHSINPDPKFKPFDVLMDEVFGMYRVLMCLSAK